MWRTVTGPLNGWVGMDSCDRDTVPLVLVMNLDMGYLLRLPVCALGLFGRSGAKMLFMTLRTNKVI
jgi:hypothetical protein